MKKWQSIETGLLMSAKYGYEIFESDNLFEKGISYKVVFTGRMNWNKWFKTVRYYKSNPQNINFGLTVRSI